MNDTVDVRSQLKSLGIAKDQRPRSTYTSKRWLRRLVILLLLCTAGFLAYRRWGNQLRELDTSAFFAKSSDAPQIPLMTVTIRTDAEAAPLLTATGKIVSDHRVQVSTKVSGQITALLFEQGDHVKQGQLLARIEDINYRARRDEAAAMLEKSRANLAFQRVNFARVESLSKGEYSQPIEYADARRWLDDAVSQIAANEAILDYSQKALDDCQVVAPIAGVVLERNVEVGDFVAAEGGRGANANAQFGTIADMSKLRVEVDVSELDIARLHKDMPCQVTPDAYKDRRYKGKILWIDPGANYSKATVQVKVRIENPDDFLRVEGSAQVGFLAQEPTANASSTKAIWIPLLAVQLDPNTSAGTVFVVRDGKFHRTAVQLGRRVGGQVEITSGLTETQQIASDRLNQIGEGQKVVQGD